MKKLYYLIFVVILATVFSCNMNSRFTNPSEYIKYAGQVNGGGSGGSGNSKVEYKTLTINVLGDGVALVNAKQYTEALKFLKDTKIDIEAIDAYGSAEKFQGWSGSITSTKHVIEDIVMDKDITLTASFVVPTEYKQLILTIRKGGGVEIDGVMHRNNAETNISVIEEYEEGKIVSLKAIPNDPNISFGGWSGSLESMDKIITVTLTDTITLSASFSADKYITINNTPNSYVEISIDNSPITKHTAETIEVKVEVGDKVEITAKANNERTHEFVRWAGSISSTEPNIDTTIAGDLSLILEFKQFMRKLTIAAPTKGQGALYKVNGQTYTRPIDLPRDSEVKIEAIEKYYPFEAWGGDITGNTRLHSFILDENKTIKASFQTGPFDVYDDSSINFESTKFDSWLIEASFDKEEFPTYNFKDISGKSWESGDANYNEYKYSGADTMAAGQNVKSVIYYQYRGINYYHKRDHADNDYNKPPHSDKLSRFRFYRFSGNPLGISRLAIDNAMCVIDTYTKLIFAYSIPTDFKTIFSIKVPIKWEALEAVNPRGENLKFYEYDPIGYVKSDGSVQLFDSFKAIQKDAAGKGNKELYYPKTPNPENPIATYGSLANSSGRSPYY